VNFGFRLLQILTQFQVFGILGIMNMVSQTFIYPVVVRTIEMKEAGFTLQERLEVFPWILSDLIFPFMMEYMMVRQGYFESQITLANMNTDVVCDMGMYPESSCRTHVFCGSWLLCRLVEQYLLGPIRS